jgi:hypothetical protein
MASRSVSIHRLWSCGDGTICVLVEHEDAPRYEICAVRGDAVMRQHRLYSRATAEMIADTWRTALTSSTIASRQSTLSSLPI